MSKKLVYYIINKPYKVLSQFTDEGGNPGLGSHFSLPKDVYPVGRLDLDSEGLLILTNDKTLNHALLNPKFAHSRTYLVEVEGVPSKETLDKLGKGVEIKLKNGPHMTKPAKVKLVEVEIPDRNPPVNIKKHPIRSWVEISITEGKNRQVRKMTASMGHPTLRLIRISIEDLLLTPLESGEIRQISKNVIQKRLNLL